MEKYRCLSGNVLKWIGIITMFIDHFGAVLVYRLVMVTRDPLWLKLYWPCRYIGRIAFPIFCFTLVEGFIHTKNRGKYLGRMCLFALISEVPFDLAIRGKWFSMGVTNVMATFTLGLLLLWALQQLLEPVKENGINPGAVLRILLAIVDIVAAMWLAEFLNMDYGAIGILAIVLFYLNRERRILAAVFGCGVLLLLGVGVSSGLSGILQGILGSVERFGLLAILPILLYNGTRGRQSKYFFYVFYPGHLLLLGLLAVYVLV